MQNKLLGHFMYFLMGFLSTMNILIFYNLRNTSLFPHPFSSMTFTLNFFFFLSFLHRIFSHPNILPVLGACQAPPSPHPIIITHYMPYGSLFNILHQGTSKQFAFMYMQKNKGPERYGLGLLLYLQMQDIVHQSWVPVYIYNLISPANNNSFWYFALAETNSDFL